MAKDPGHFTDFSAEGWILPTALLLEPSTLESSPTLPEPEGPFPWCQSTRLVVLS